MNEMEQPGLVGMAATEYSVYLSDAQKRLEISVEYAQAALKALFFVNGASIVALLTFIGNGGHLIEPIAIFWAFVWFTIGLLAVLLAYFGAYFSQAFYMQDAFKDAWNARARMNGLETKRHDQSDQKIGNFWMKVTVLAAITSIVSFVAGAFVALDAIT